MRTSLTMLLYLVNDILDIKALNNGKFFTNEEQFYPKDVFNQILCTTDSLANNKNLNLRFKFVRPTDHIGSYDSLSTLIEYSDNIEIENDLPEILFGD